jgi:hypothetical protein
MTSVLLVLLRHQPRLLRAAFVGAGCLVACTPLPLICRNIEAFPAVSPYSTSVHRASRRACAGTAPVLVVGDTTRWTAVVGIALSAKPGTSHVWLPRRRA